MFVLKGRAPDTNDAKIADSLRGTPVLVLDHDQEGIVRDPRVRELYARCIQEFADYVRRLGDAGDVELRDPGLLDRLDAGQYDELRRLLKPTEAQLAVAI